MPEIRITYQNKAFIMQDMFIEVLSHFICRSFEAIGLETFKPSLITIYGNCDGNRKYPESNTLGLLLDYAITNDIDAQTLIDVLERAKPIIFAYGTILTPAELNELEDTKPDDFFKVYWESSIYTESLVTTLTLIQQLLDGTFPYDLKSYQYQGYGGITPSQIII